MKPRYSVVMPCALADRKMIAEALKKIGYKDDKETNIGETIVTYQEGMFSFFNKSRDRDGLGNTGAIRLNEFNLDLLVSLASQTSDTDLDNWFVFLHGKSEYAFTSGKLYKCLKIDSNTFCAFIDDKGVENGYYPNNLEYFRKATADEIIQELKKKETPMNEKIQQFTVSGNKHLLKAFEQDLLENGYKKSYLTNEYPFIHITNSNIGYVHGIVDRKVKHYELPKRYEEAKACALSYLKPKEINYTIVSHDDDSIVINITKDNIDFRYKYNPISVSIHQLMVLIEQIKMINNNTIHSWGVSVENIKVGCRSIKASDIISIYNLYNENFK